MVITHRAATGRSFRGIPIHAAGGVHEHCLELLRQHQQTGAHVLDVGAGSGALSARLLEAGFDVESADLDPSDLAAECPGHAWDASGPDLGPLAPKSFDAVCAVEIIEHCENPLQALRNFRALLRPGGTLIISTPHVTHPRSRLKFLVRGEPSYFGRAEYHSSGHRTILADWLLKEHLEATGFTDLDRSYAGALGLVGKEQLLYRALLPVLRVGKLLPTPRTEDGACVFFTARG